MIGNNVMIHLLIISKSIQIAVSVILEITFRYELVDKEHFMTLTLNITGFMSLLWNVGFINKLKSLYYDHEQRINEGYNFNSKH